MLAALGVSGALLGAGIVYGCSVYDSSLLLPAVDSGVEMHDAFASDAGFADAHETSVVEAAPGPCPELQPPGKPAANDPADGGDQGFVVALHTVDFGFGDAGASSDLRIGYDLDKVYTCCDAGPESCKAATTGSTHCDDPMGRDNSGAHLIGTLAAVDPSQFNTGTISERIANGTYSILLQVLHYNGQANDDQVTVALYGSLGVESDAGARWDGTDSWSIDDAFVVEADATPLLPNHIDGNAYVTDGTLVSHVNFPISLGNSSTTTFTISLTAGVITGQIVPAPGGSFALAGGTIAGRWNVAQLLQSLQTVVVGTTPLCPGMGSNVYSFVKGEICQYADIMTDPMADLKGSTCDALSLGVGFTADPALLGGVQPSAIRSSLCPPTDAAPDDCTKP